jgi:hypothetical protein
MTKLFKGNNNVELIHLGKICYIQTCAT